MLKLENSKKILIAVIVLMTLMFMQSTVFATNTIVITNTTQNSVQQIPTLDSSSQSGTTSGNQSSGTTTTIPTTNSITTTNTSTTTTNNSNARVTVTITSNKQLQALSGWTLSTDKKVLTKVYTANANETITLTDTAGNKSDAIPIKVDLSLTNGGTNGEYGLGSSDTNKPTASVKYTKTTGSDYTKGNLPKTGIDYSALIILVICVISGVYAYIKIRDYNQIKY